MRRKSPETVKTPALNYTKLVFCIIELDAWDRIFGATPAVNFSRKSAWDTCSAAYAAAFTRTATAKCPMQPYQAPGQPFKFPCVFLQTSMRLWQAPVRFTEPHTILASSHAVLPSSHAVSPASVRHRLIAPTPAADKFLLRPCHAVFAILCAHRTKPPLLKPSDSRRFVVFLRTLCRRFDDAPIVARPASIMKTSARN